MRGDKLLKRFAEFCRAAALVLFLLTVGTLAVCGLFFAVSNHTEINQMSQAVTLLRGAFGKSLLLSICMGAGLALVHRALERLGGVRLKGAVLLAWAAASAAWVLMVRAGQRADALNVLEAAKSFAAGNYDVLRYSDYFHAYSYLVGTCLPFELLARLTPPHADLNLLLQLINVVMGTAAGGVLAALAQTLFERNDVSVACLLLYVLFLPTLLFNTFVYGVLPMVLLTVCAFFCFARHVRTKKRGYAAAYALCIGIAAVMKPNAMLVALALFICSLLVAVEERDDIIILASIFSLMLCVVLPRMVVLFYEYRVGVTLESNTGSITRFAMGMQDSPIAAGWFNGYSESIWPRSWSWYSAKGVIAKESMGLLEPMADFAAVERETALAAIRERLAQMGADPGMTLRFYREKLLTQWLEPECDILWMLNVSEKTGRYDGLARMVCGDGQALHAAITAYLAVLQRVIYALAFAGGVSALRKKWESVLLMIPVTVLGGVLYHLLFEAKSQYAYPYIVYLMPFAAQGLCLAEDAVRCRWQKIKKQ